MKKLIATTILALTLNSAINSTAYAHDSEVFGLGGLLGLSDGSAKDKAFAGSNWNVGCSSSSDNNSYYKAEVSFSSVDQRDAKTEK